MDEMNTETLMVRTGVLKPLKFDSLFPITNIYVYLTNYLLLHMLCKIT